MNTGVSIPYCSFTKEQQQELLKLQKGKPMDDRHEQFYALCDEHIRHAREKHPEFAKTVSIYGEYALSKMARNYKSVGNISIEAVLFSEVYEFLAELQRGDKARAREEGADIVAVVLRACEGDHLKEGGNQ